MPWFQAIYFSLLSLLHLVWGRVIFNGNDGNEKQKHFFLIGSVGHFWFIIFGCC